MVDVTAEGKQANKSALYYVILLALVYATFFSALTVRRHDAHQTTGYDLGIIDQTLWNTLHGRILETSFKPGIRSRLSLHFEPILVLLVPFYMVYPGPETLLVLQSLIVGFGALPLFLMTREKVGDWCAVGFSICYLLFPAIEAANVFDFHAITLASTFLAGALWGMKQRRYLLFALFAGLAMACKEEIPFIVCLMGISILLVNRDRLPGLATIFLSLLWLAVGLAIVIPARSKVGLDIHVQRYPGLGSGLGAMIRTLLTQPLTVIKLMTEGEKAWTLLRLIMPVGFLSLLDPLTLVLAAPSIAINLLSDYRPMHALDVYHYWGPIVPFVVTAAATGTRRLAELAQHRLGVKKVFVTTLLTLMILFLTLVYHRALGYTPLRADFSWPQVTPHHRLLSEITPLIPQEASIAAQNPLVPHISQRENVTVFPDIGLAEYVLLDRTAPIGAGVVEEMSQYEQAIDSLMRDERFSLVLDRDGYLLFKRRVTVE